MCDYFRRLVLAIDPLRPAYLPIDVDGRDDWLSGINETYGWSLATDWRVIGSSPDKWHFSETDADIINHLQWELRSFFGRFGYDRRDAQPTIRG